MTCIRTADGTVYELEFIANDPFITARLTLNDLPIGRAHLSIAGEVATLADIRIDNKVPRTWWLTQLICPKFLARDFRGRGLGTSLLRAICEHLQRTGVEKVVGSMSGDIVRVTRWYRSMGFTVDQGSNRIEKILKSGC